MAEGKKSFLLYADMLPTIKKMVVKDRENKTNNAGELFLHLLEYVSDNDPEPVNDIVDLMFEPFKTQLKRDLHKWEEKSPQRVEKARIAGLASAEARKLKKELNSTNELEIELNSTKSTVSVSDSVTVSDILLKKETKVNISDRKLIFYNSLIPYTQTYGKVMLREFYEYWTEHGENDLKFRKEKEKTFGLERRLKTWSTNNFNNKTGFEKTNSIIPDPNKRKRFD